MKKGNRPIRVLLIEDNPADMELIRRLLLASRNISFDLKWAKNLTEGLGLLGESEIDILLCDLDLPESTGIDTFTKIYERTQTIPIIVLTGSADEELAMKTVHMGAQDYIFKGEIDIQFLVRSIRYAIERKEFENRLRRTLELERLTEILEKRVEERTAELERSNKELQEFAFVASHDLSEPLRKIQTFGSLLEARSAGLLDERSKDYISRMVGASIRMQELLDALLRYSRIETSKEDFGPTRLEDVAQVAAGDLEVAIRGCEARVEIGTLPTVVGDPSQLRQLFQNLIANAVKYHRPETRPVVKVYGEEGAGTGRVFVEDNGIGFDERYLEKIFQPFQRLHGRSEYSGTGMGLSICKKIVERHGGSITARSTPGTGSTFIVTLPSSLSGPQPL